MSKTTHFYRDTWAEINLESLYENTAAICEHLPEKTYVFAAVKANAYGHGDVQTAHTVLEAGAHGLVVAFLDEALALRENGITAPILVLGVTSPSHAGIAAKHHISLTVFQAAWLKEAQATIASSDQLCVHIKCDTGMGRIGLKEAIEIREIERILLTADQFVFEGIYTHFATADQLDTSYYQKQLKTFKELLNALESKPAYIHAANSAAALFHTDATFNAVRIGIALYGLSPSEEMKSLFPFQRKEVLSLQSKITHIKQLRAGESVGYGAVYTAASDEWVATIPIGYADGWIRKLQGQEVIAEGERVPIVGRICMDQTMIKLPRYMPLGTKVTLIGEQAGQFISIDEIAEKIDTINYEVTCMITPRVPRVYLGGNLL
ncbi:alanine racemase [Bacillus sp. FSL K6-3431]|uniref:alanine racemase n=1 Tax=Bacillus sp. FSL K6-3431 TaxID=2921500 RepID=UPI0030F792E8